MTDEQINRAVAEVCGWTLLEKSELTKCCACNAKDPHGHLVVSAPDYCNDLNAMHEVEKVLADKSAMYTNFLAQWVNEGFETPGAWCWHATARQRAEAFLRTMGKWGEQPTTNELLKPCGLVVEEAAK